MATFVYSPGIRVHISTDRGLIDVSDDLEQGHLTITENDIATFQFSLVNHRCKYDNVFTPNDRITVQMKRVTWLPVFTGYLDSVPYYSVYPRSVPLSASDALKRLKYHLWDAGSDAAHLLLSNDSSIGTEDVAIDASIGNKLMTLLTEPSLGGFDRDAVHIGHLPAEWFTKIAPLYDLITSQLTPENLLVDTMTTSADSIGTGSIPDIPADYLTLYRTWAARLGHGLEWSLLAAIGKIETDHGRSTLPGVKSGTNFAGAGGPMQFLKATFDGYNAKYDLTGRGDHQGSLYSPHDAIGAAGHLLIDNGNGDLTNTSNEHNAIWHYNQSEKYISDVRAQRDIYKKAGVAAGDAVVAGKDAAIGTPAYDPGNKQGFNIQSATNLDGITAGALSMINFVKASADGKFKYSISAVKTGHTSNAGTSLHPSGLAVDFGNAGVSDNDMNAIHNLLLPLANNPNTYQLQEFFYTPKNSFYRKGVAFSPDSGLRDEHQNHIHAAVKDANNFDPTGAGSNADGTPTAGGNQMIRQIWGGDTVDEASHLLAGPLALMNDDPILETVKTLCQASMRKFMAAPNGDFISWFPDYFGIYNTAAKMQIEDIELAGDGFTIMWNDEYLITHQYVAGAATDRMLTVTDTAVNITEQAKTKGVISVDFPEVMKTLFNVSPDDPRSGQFFNKDEIYKRFGARKNYTAMGNIYGPKQEFWYALFLFQQNWASQFSSTVSLTFMPELWPGMLLSLPKYKFQAYIEQVIHSFDFRTGGMGFTTQVGITSPSATSGSGLFALPKGN